MYWMYGIMECMWWYEVNVDNRHFLWVSQLLKKDNFRCLNLVLGCITTEMRNCRKQSFLRILLLLTSLSSSSKSQSSPTRILSPQMSILTKEIPNFDLGCTYNVLGNHPKASNSNERLFPFKCKYSRSKREL